MTSFRLTDNQQAFIDAVHKFAENDLRKHLRPADEAGAVPEQVLTTGWGLGFAPTAIPEEHDGFADEQPAVTAALAYEELDWGDLSPQPCNCSRPPYWLTLYANVEARRKERYICRNCGAGKTPALTAALL